jgi:hypothetical protein
MELITQFLAQILAFIQTAAASPWLPPVIALLVGWGLPTPAWLAWVWGGVMSFRGELTTIGQLIDTINTILQANGLIPVDGPKVTEAQVRQVLEGKVSLEMMVKSHRAACAAHNAMK